MMLIDGLDECIKAVAWIISIYPNISDDVRIQNDTAYPKGCNVLVHKNRSYGIFFNTVPSNNPNKNARQVCGAGKVFISFDI